MAPNPLAKGDRIGEKIGNSFYRKLTLYNDIFEDDVELENYIVVGAPYGGAIGKGDFLGDVRFKAKLQSALHLDETKPSRLRAGQSSRSTVDIYSCSGQRINRINVILQLPVKCEIMY